MFYIHSRTMYHVVSALILLSGVGITVSADEYIDKSMIELRLLLDVVRGPDDTDGSDWEVVYVTRNLEQGPELFQLPQYRRELPVVILIHGFQGSADLHNIHMKAMLSSGYRQRFNLVALNMPVYFNWSVGNLWYLLPARRAKLVGMAVGALLQEMEKQGLIPQGQIHLVGFSLGAQTAGYISRTAKGSVASIIGLDPAGPGFDSKMRYNYLLTHVTRDDAPVVHMYHTNSNYLGTTKRTATADVVFNNGWHQPGCSTANIFCSHRRALLLFTQVILQPFRFEARRCGSHRKFTSCKCLDNEILDLTFPPDPIANGTYYLNTSGEVPFGEGRFGTVCAKKIKTLSMNNTVSEDTSSFLSKLVTLKSYHILNRSSAKEINSESTIQKGDDTEVDQDVQKLDQESLLSKIRLPLKLYFRSSEKREETVREEEEVPSKNNKSRASEPEVHAPSEEADLQSIVSEISDVKEENLKDKQGSESTIPEGDDSRVEEAEQKIEQESLLSKISFPLKYYFLSTDKGEETAGDENGLPKGNNKDEAAVHEHSKEAELQSSVSEKSNVIEEHKENQHGSLSLLSRIESSSRLLWRGTDKDKNIVVEVNEIADSSVKDFGVRGGRLRGFLRPRINLSVNMFSKKSD